MPTLAGIRERGVVEQPDAADEVRAFTMAALAADLGVRPAHSRFGRPVRFRDALPAFYGEIERALQAEGVTGVLEQLPTLEIIDRCDCDERGCGTFHVAASRPLNQVEMNIVGVRHGESTPLDVGRGLVVVDTDNFGRVTGIEVLDRLDVAAVLKELRVPTSSGRTTR